MPALAAPIPSPGYTVGRLEASNNCRDAFLNVMLGLEISVLAQYQSGAVLQIPEEHLEPLRDFSDYCRAVHFYASV